MVSLGLYVLSMKFSIRFRWIIFIWYSSCMIFVLYDILLVRYSSCMIFFLYDILLIHFLFFFLVDRCPHHSSLGRRLHLVTGDANMRGARPWARVWMHRSTFMQERYFNLIPVGNTCMELQPGLLFGNNFVD